MPPSKIDRDSKPYTDAKIRFTNEHDGRIEELPFEEWMIAQRQGKRPNKTDRVDKD